MKRIIILVITVFLIHSCCIEPEPEDVKSNYTIKNASTHNVKLKIFDLYIQESNYYCDTTLLLMQSSEVSFQYKFLSYLDGAFGPAADSVYIIFDDVRQIIYRRNDGNPRDIFNINNWDKIIESDTYFKYIYIITDEDYSNATTIEK